jgi:hypothetical protein
MIRVIENEYVVSCFPLLTRATDTFNFSDGGEGYEPKDRVRDGLWSRVLRNLDGSIRPAAHRLT